MTIVAVPRHPVEADELPIHDALLTMRCASLRDKDLMPVSCRLMSYWIRNGALIQPCASVVPHSIVQQGDTASDVRPVEVRICLYCGNGNVASRWSHAPFAYALHGLLEIPYSCIRRLLV